jgi:hypothetical protein
MAAKVVSWGDAESVGLGFTGAKFLLDGLDGGSRFALVEYPMEPRALAAPIHRHHREDEYSFVLEGAEGGFSETIRFSVTPGTLS